MPKSIPKNTISQSITKNTMPLNSSQVKIKYEFYKPFPCDCWYVQQNMIIHDTLTRPFSEKYKMLRKANNKDFFLLKTMHF